MFKTQVLLSEALAIHALPVAIAVSLLVGCGGNSAPKPIAQASPSTDSVMSSQSDDSKTATKPAAASVAQVGASLSDNACIAKANCPAAELDFLYSGGVSSDGRLMGSIGSDVAWSFAGLDHKSMATGANTSSRKTVVFVVNGPAAAIVTPPAGAPALANVLKINWTSSIASSGSFTVVVRDYERCKFNLSGAQCEAQTVLTDFDKSFGPIPFAITQDGTGTALVAAAVAGTIAGTPMAGAPSAILPQPTTTTTTPTLAPTTTTTTTTKKCSFLGTLLSFGSCLF